MQQLLQRIHEDIIIQVIPVAAWVPIHVVFILGLLGAAGLILGWMTLIAMGWIYAERRVAGYIQARYGPNRVGPWGILQSLADGIKLLTKEDIIPAAANRFLYEMAPLLVFAGAFIPFVVLPFSQHLVIADMDLGIFYIMAFGALEVVGILMAGWAPNSKWTLYGGMRLAAQMLSYEIPLGLMVLVIVILSGSLNLGEIIEWQTAGLLMSETWSWEIPFLEWKPLGFLSWGIFRGGPYTFIAFILFYICALAETKRAPFDLPEAESELVSGFHTEYTGIRFSYFFLSEYCAMYVMSVLGVVLYLGGWFWPLPTWEVTDVGFIDSVSAGLKEKVSFEAISYEGLTLTESVWEFRKAVWVTVTGVLWYGPIESVQAFFEPKTLSFVCSEAFGFINLVGKSFVLLFIMLWVRWTLPRLRIDQVMHLCLKVLLPFGLFLVVLASIQAAFTPTPDAPEPAAAVVETVIGDEEGAEPAAGDDQAEQDEDDEPSQEESN